MNGIENFLLRGREKRRERVRNGGEARRGQMGGKREKKRKRVRRVGKGGADEGERESEAVRIKRTPAREKEGQRATGAEGT